MGSSTFGGLRMGIMCQGYRFPAWAAECLAETLDLPYVKTALLIRDATVPSKPKSFLHKLFTYPYRLLLNRVYLRFSKARSAMFLKNMEEDFAGVPVINCHVELRGKHSQYFTAEDVALIRSHNLDFIVRFGFNIIRGDILQAAKYGVWSFHHSDEQKYRGGPAGFWEIYNNDNATGAILQRLTNKLDGGIILRKGWFKTVKKSWRANFDQTLWGTTTWIRSVCVDIQNGNTDYLEDEPVQTTAPIFKYPRNFQMVVFFLRQAYHAFAFHWQELFVVEKWNVGLIRKPISSVYSGVKSSEISWLPEAVAHEYHADPFLVKIGTEVSILAEIYSYKIGKGAIVQLPVTAKGPSRIAIQELHHLSYPYTFTCTSGSYCIPEAEADKKVSLYAHSEEGNWERVHMLISDFHAVDPTIIEQDGKFWLFCTSQEKGANSHLFLFHAPSLKGPFTPHCKNPVKCDVRSARPAGRPFPLDGKLIRPAQNCSKTYGGEIVFNQIQVLTEGDFKEEVIGSLGPSQGSRYPEGLHHIDHLDDLVCIDGKRHTFDGYNLLRKLKQKAKRVIR